MKKVPNILLMAIIFALLMSCGSSAIPTQHAEEIVETKDGRTIKLRGDGTWKEVKVDIQKELKKLPGAEEKSPERSASSTGIKGLIEQGEKERLEAIKTYTKGIKTLKRRLKGKVSDYLIIDEIREKERRLKLLKTLENKYYPRLLINKVGNKGSLFIYIVEIVEVLNKTSFLCKIEKEGGGHWMFFLSVFDKSDYAEGDVIPFSKLTELIEITGTKSYTSDSGAQRSFYELKPHKQIH